MRGLVAAAAAGLLLLLAGGAYAASARGSLYRPVQGPHIEQRTHTAQAELDKVEHLPGWGKPSPGLFSGYVTVNESAGRALFYVFAEAEEDSSSLPLVLWLNGGPGCSSLAGGFLSELGPYYPTNEPGRLQRNEFAWTQAANVVFLESPAFVGWSYSNTSADADVGDKRTAADSYVFLEKFLERFPAYVGREFWIAGESYGGHYVPNLAHEIVTRQRGMPDSQRSINLQGFLVGNAWTNARIENMGAIDFWWSHSLISDDTRAGALKTCNFSNIGPLRDELPGVDPQACAKYVARATEEMGAINIYEIYADVCRDWRADADGRQLLRALAGPDTLLRQGQYDPCIDNEVQAYFNRPDVQAALHANCSEHALPYGPWMGCSTIVQYSQDDLFSSMLPVYRELLAVEPPLSMLVFSGDVDGIVPTLGTRRWIRALDLPIKRPWRPWTSSTGQVGGYVEQYHGLTFATVRNAGHMVPYTQAERSYYVFSRWIQLARSNDVLFFEALVSDEL